jgi:succinoglycan biosynthesis transport protein ExoP
MDLGVYLKPLRRWWWLIIAATLIAGVASYLAMMRQPPYYQAKTTLLVGRSINNPTPSQSDLYLASQLAGTYADIANREPVQNATKKALGLTWLPEYLARAVLNSQFIEIVVTDDNPLRAQVVANEIANQLILSSPTSDSQEQERQDFINKQLNLLQSQILETQDEITKLKEQLGSLNSARQIADTQSQITALQTKLTTLQGNYAVLLSNTKQGATNTLSVVVPAELPVTPVGPNKALSVLLSAAIGFVLAVGAAYLLEYLDDTIKSSEELSHILHIPVIGKIGYIKREKTGDQVEKPADHIMILRQPFSPVVETFRALQMNLMSISQDPPKKVFLITSAKPSEGKSITLANLAVTMAQSGLKVIVVDGDLRKPTIHDIFNLPNTVGLSDALMRSKTNARTLLQSTEVDNLQVLTSGMLPPSPTLVLGSKRTMKAIEELSSEADFVLVDSPPILSVADTLNLGSCVDGVILLTVEGFTRRGEARRSLEELRTAGINVIGAILRKVKSSEEGYSYYHYYSSNKTTDRYSENSASASERISSYFRHLRKRFNKNQGQ